MISKKTELKAGRIKFGPQSYCERLSKITSVIDRYLGPSPWDG